MARRGDTARARSVKAVFDDAFSATVHGGAVLFEKVIRAVGLRKIFDKHLPRRDGDYSSSEVCEQVVEGLLCGGKGFQAAQTLRQDSQLARVFGHEQVAEEATVWRALSQMAGLGLRKLQQAYEPAAKRYKALDVLGQEKPERKLRMKLPESPETMSDSCRQQWVRAQQELALRCAQRLACRVFSLMGFFPCHGDASELEVRGRCFQAAKPNYNGDLSLRLLSLSAGPIYLGANLLPGATDEANSLPGLIEESAWLVEKLRGKRRVLCLLDAAYAEKAVVEQMITRQWHYIISANQWSGVLERLARELGEAEWSSQGADEARGWQESQVAVFRHTPEGWPQTQTVVARRWREKDELPGTWHYGFLYTDLARELLPKAALKRYGFAPLVWMLYSTKQGRENLYKSWLSDLGGHHPASSRLGASQALILLQAMAANLHAVISYRVVAEPERGIRLWRFVRDYVLIAARVVMHSGKTLTVHLAGADISACRRQRWLAAYAAAEGL